MTTLTTPKDKVRLVLAIFKRNHCHAGDRLERGQIFSAAADLNLSIDEIDEGIQEGAVQGLFEGGIDTALELTRAGYEAM